MQRYDLTGIVDVKPDRNKIRTEDEFVCTLIIQREKGTVRATQFQSGLGRAHCNDESRKYFVSSSEPGAATRIQRGKRGY